LRYYILTVIFSKSKLKIGYPYKWIRRIFYDIAVLRSDFVLESLSCIHMLNILGYKRVDLIYGFENKYVKHNLKRIIYFAGASTQDKRWEEEKFISLIKLMANKYKDYMHIILQGIKEDEKFLNIFEAVKMFKNVQIKSAMKLDETMQYLSDSRLVISNDTGIRNMAIAVDTPTIGIFFATGAFRYWPRNNKHECVFNLNYTSPSVEDVFNESVRLLNINYK